MFRALLLAILGVSLAAASPARGPQFVLVKVCTKGRPCMTCTADAAADARAACCALLTRKRAQHTAAALTVLHLIMPAPPLTTDNRAAPSSTTTPALRQTC